MPTTDPQPSRIERLFALYHASIDAARAERDAYWCKSIPHATYRRIKADAQAAAVRFICAVNETE